MIDAENVAEYVPILLGFCTGLTVLGGLIIAITTFAIRKHFRTVDEKDKLKEVNMHKTIKSAVQDSHSDLRLLIEKQHGDFKLLEAEVNNAVREMKVIAFDIKPKKGYSNGAGRVRSS